VPWSRVITTNLAGERLARGVYHAADHDGVCGQRDRDAGRLIGGDVTRASPSAVARTCTRTVLAAM